MNATGQHMHSDTVGVLPFDLTRLVAVQRLQGCLVLEPRAHETVDRVTASRCDTKAKVPLSMQVTGGQKRGMNPEQPETTNRLKMLGVKGPTELAFNFNWTQTNAYQVKE